MNVHIPTEPVRAWLENLPAEKKPLIGALRQLIASVAPEAHESISRGAVWYSPPDSGYPILYLTVFQAHVNLGFFWGGFVPDPEGLLIGSGKRMRHIKIRSPQECENPAIASLLARAWADGVQRVKQLPLRRT